jgi:ribosome-associated toxin RatA of RatAB toxin-antitoxin module
MEVRMADAVKDTIDVAARLKEVFEVATDLESYPEWNQNIKEVEVRARDEEGRPLEVWMKVDAKLKVLQYTLGYEYKDAPQSFSWHLIEGDVKELQGTYSFDEFDDVTEVTYEMKVDPGFPVPAFLRRQASRQIARSALEDLKGRVESR